MSSFSNDGNKAIGENATIYVLSDFKQPNEVAAGKETMDRGDSMDDSAKTLLTRLDQDMRDHKQEMRDRDASIVADAKERENRYREEMKGQDERWRQESKEREERLMSAINDMKNDLRADFRDVKDESRTTRNTVIALTVSIILGVAAMVLAVIYGID